MGVDDFHNEFVIGLVHEYYDEPSKRFGKKVLPELHQTLSEAFPESLEIPLIYVM